MLGQSGDVKQKTYEGKSCPERKGLLSHMLAEKRAMSWSMQTKPQVTGLGGEDKHVHCPGIEGTLLYNRLEKKGVSCFEIIYIGYR